MPDSLDGNETQARKVARQLFTAWAEETNASRTNKWGSIIPAWIAVAVSVGGLIWNAAVLSRDVKDNTRRIDLVETEQRRSSVDDRQVVDRMARIEAKLDIVLEAK